MDEEKLVAIRFDIAEETHMKVKILAKAKFEIGDKRTYHLNDIYKKLIERGLAEILKR